MNIVKSAHVECSFSPMHNLRYAVNNALFNSSMIHLKLI